MLPKYELFTGIQNRRRTQYSLPPFSKNPHATKILFDGNFGQISSFNC